MKKFLFLGLMTTQVFAATLLIEKHVESGLMIPENSFTYDCAIKSNRQVVITRREGIESPQTHTHRFSKATKAAINSLVHIASDGRIEDLSVTCDGGDRTLYGYHHGEKFILDENLDCGTHKLNRSRATVQLKKIARKLCGF